MKIDIITLFPHMFEGIFNHSIIGRAKEKNLVNIEIHDLRQFGIDERKTVDDRPYGGGVGMILMIEPIDKILKSLDLKPNTPNQKIILTSASGKIYKQQTAKEYSSLERLTIICGRYEGVDERVTNLIDDQICIGDFVLTGGEIASMAITDSITRLIPGVLEKEGATELESFTNPQLLEEPKYTRPENYNGLLVPEILLSGNHAKIEEWKKEESLKITQKNRPDLIK